MSSPPQRCLLCSRGPEPEGIALRPDEILLLHCISFDKIQNRQVNNKPEQLLKVIGQTALAGLHLMKESHMCIKPYNVDAPQTLGFKK